MHLELIDNYITIINEARATINQVVANSSMHELYIEKI